MRTCDLHVHSTYSDGTYTPAELIGAAARAGLSAIALCDHNTVDGVPELLRAAEGSGVEAIAGAEFSVEYEGGELHLLGLFIPERFFAQIRARMEEADRRKEESNLALIESLCRAGFPLDYGEIKRKTSKGRVNRMNIARAMKEHGYVASTEEAFARYLSPNGAHYVPPARIGFWEMLEYLHEIGAAPVLAHPFLSLSRERLVLLLPEAKRRGLCGMECFYSTFSKEETACALELASAFGLLASGGSDFHGENKPEIRLGVGCGDLSVPYECVEALRESVF